MNVEILAVGTELLLGDITNTNAQFLSKELAAMGMNVYFQTVVGDNPERLKSALEIAFGRADTVITTGGLGPTDDDLTKEVGAQYFHRELVFHQESWDIIAGYFKVQNFQISENNKKQAYIPEGAQVLANDKGTAPGVMIEENGKILIMMPGPPSETIPMFENQVAPLLQKKMEGIFLSRTLRISGVGESMAEDLLKDMIQNQSNPTIAPYAKAYEVHFRITAAAKDETEARQIMEPSIQEIYKRLGNNIYGEDGTTLEAAVVKLIMEKQMTIACAESCTGGLLTAQLVDCPGVSAIFLEGAVTYNNQAKEKRLGVKSETLEKFGAVSAETAAEMAAGIAYMAGANIGLSITGIAGPDGGTQEKPVGLVYLGLSINGKISTKELHFRGDRKKIRGRSVAEALDFLRRALLEF